MEMDRQRAPLFEALAAHSQLEVKSFHVPGHKQNVIGFDVEAAAYYTALLALDVTELSDTDDLHHPQGPIVEAQALAADCYGAEETSFLVGGSTVGNLAMILGSCNPGELLLVQRNVHKSIIHGLMLAGARAVLLPPLIDPLSGLATLPDEALLQAALTRYPDAKAVILSTPNYYGMNANLKPHVELAHAHGIPLLVDEAHGPHFGFHPAFPTSAIQLGADVVVQSTHKMLSAMTMGAMLHMQGNRIRKSEIRQALRMVQSSSPSFPLLASLDLARQQLHTAGQAVFHSALDAVRAVTSNLQETPFRALGYGKYASIQLTYDPLKLVLFDESGNLNGFELREELLKHRCVAEMADSRYVVLAFGTGSSLADGEALIGALSAIADHMKGHSSEKQSSRQFRPQPSQQSTQQSTQQQDPNHFSDSLFNQSNVVPEAVAFSRGGSNIQSVRLEDCVGLTSAEWIIPYPPGIPILFPGEPITSQILEQLLHWQHAGAQIQGAQDRELKFIQVEAKE